MRGITSGTRLARTAIVGLCQQERIKDYTLVLRDLILKETGVSVEKLMSEISNKLGVTLIEDLYAISQVAQILSCSRKTVYRLIATGRLRAVRWGRTYRFRREDIQQFLQSSIIER